MADAASQPLRVLQIGSALHDWGGIERYLVYLQQGLAERGHAVTTVCPPGSPLEQRLGGDKVAIGLRKQYQLSSLPRYVRFLRQNAFDIVHVHFSRDFLVPTLAAKLTHTRPVILSRHVALRWSRTQVKRYVWLFDHIIPVSEAVRMQLLASGVPSERMTVAKAGQPALAASSSRDRVRQELGVSADGFAVGSFGRLVPEKGLDVLIRAMASVQNATCHLFGAGPSEAFLRDLIRSERCEGKVTLHGRTDSVADAMAAMDIIAIPSVWQEAFPYAALEAMSLGRPILGSCVGGIPELVQDGETGLLFENRNSAQLSTLIQGLSERRSELVRMGETGQTRYQENYTVPHMAARIEKVYQNVLSQASVVPSSRKLA